MIKFSVINDNVIGADKRMYTDTVSGKAKCAFEKLGEVMVNHHIAVGIYTDNIKRCKNLISTDLLIFDFDDGTQSVEEATADIKEYDYILVGSKNHLKDKGDGKGIIPRFHLIIKLKESIVDSEFYGWLASEIATKLKFKNDHNVKDSARYLYKHSSVIETNITGKSLDPSAFTSSYARHKKSEADFQAARQKRMERILATRELDINDRTEACKAYIVQHLDPAICGNGQADVNFFKVACTAVKCGANMMEILNWFNQHLCTEPQSKKYLDSKRKKAENKVSDIWSDKFLKQYLP